MRHQYTSSIYAISSWADFVTAHVVAGEDAIKVLDGVLLLTNMSTSKDKLDFTDTCLEWYDNSASASASTDDSTPSLSKPTIAGFIGQKRSYSQDIPLWTPGVSKPSITSDGLGQVYRDPKSVVMSGTDTIIVGRGIVQAGSGSTHDQREAAKWFRDEGWRAYLRRCTVMMS